MKKKNLNVLLFTVLTAVALTACGDVKEEVVETTEETVQSVETVEASEVETDIAGEDVLEDGIYVAEFLTDSSMFHVNEEYNNKGMLTVENGQMTIHITLAAKGILNLYPGLAADAEKDGAVLLEPTIDLVNYSDGTTDEVYGFDVPVPYLDDEFDVALIGKKGVWYDHKVSVKNPVAGGSIDGSNNAEAGIAGPITSDGVPLDDGEYQVTIAMEGGSGKAKIDSPAKMMVQDGAATVTITWSSPNYDYMLVDGEKYLPVNTEDNSVFEIPVSVLDEKITVIGDTTAMSTPHEVEYTIICSIL